MKITYEKVKTVAKKHLVDSTSILAAVTPIWTLFDTVALDIIDMGMADEVSMGAKITSAGLTYFGMGWVYTKLRDVTKKYLKITDKTKQRYHSLHGLLYNATYSTLFTGLMYSVAQEQDQAKMGLALGFALFTSPLRGPFADIAIDVGRDLVGLKESNREIYPKKIKYQTPKFKKRLAAGLVAASIGIQALTYAITPDKLEWDKLFEPEEQIEQQEIRENADAGNLEKKFY